MPSFQKLTVPFSEIGVLPNLVKDYLSGNCQWLTGYDAASGFETVFEGRIKKGFGGRNKLSTLLTQQHGNPSPAQHKNIERLVKENTFTVTTGHQLNLFTGPLYFIYKIVTTINLAEQLNGKYKDKHFVPVYWMASEDHDIDEINHVFLYGKKIEWKTNQQGAAGRLKCIGIDAVIDEVQNLLGTSENATDIVALLRKCYSEQHSLSQATRMLVNHFFGKYGLLILDADDAGLKEEFRNIMQDDLTSGNAFNLVSKTIFELEGKKYEVQVRPREINLFYLGDKYRWRIVKEDGGFTGLDKEGNKHALENEALDKPESLSPNVVLRPLYQETILPNVAYVGGPAEIAYWLEYKSLFDYYGVNYPVLVLRNSAMIIEEAIAAKVSKLGLKAKDLFETTDELSKKYVLKQDEPFSILEEEEKVKSVFDDLKKRVESIDITLSATVEAEKQKQLNSLKVLEEKVIRAGKRRHETSIQQIQKIKEKLFPNGKLHERTDNFIPYYVKYGDDFIDSLMQSLEPTSDSVTILEER
jgi:bacillithiol biosynthesis cysteine-adding enzyme BshC